ncbi:class I SAM-dependent methyltransferase [Bradyrhizobium sp. INPA01-394B]|uniref:Class I SAM-dependent methyltransferase n=1 Tax=Bradyrhizobium campsiandrae TaxID=1729892 RepID=A0ABR7UIL5_9BRAD|nr:class I SAM-dependent methyltransferase [Bradyrhizobium campsiandrae]MBC9883516.1 class I SAM-dependent methyltransferase [Bradyrhizobium campsiandrae]MBC9983891.1 class I SAM-dependent methyltransferase [Bradyrhizobium campsiandrae]
MLDQTILDADNRQFWQHVCGTKAAKLYGFDGDDAQSIGNFDRWFFDYYPYLRRFIPFNQLAGRRVLEIGLGYGSVSEALSRAGAILTGLDISPGPVNWLRHRLSLSGTPGEAVEGSALAIPFPDESFDYVVTIGCLHHTGDLMKSISEVHRVLRKGAGATIMVYSATSHLRWLKYPTDTFRYVRSVASGSDKPLPLGKDGRAEFDADPDGNIAPEVVVVSKTALARMLRPFSVQKIHRANVPDHPIIGRIPRAWRLESEGRIFGTDLYAIVKK